MKGLTLIEILITIAILGILAAVTAGALPAFRKQAALDTAVEDVYTAVVRARTRTLSAENASVYGVHLANSAVTVFQGSSYTDGAPGNEATALPDAVSISNVSLAGGGDDIIFQRLTGATENNGTITLQLVADVSKIRTVRVEKSGTVSVE